MVYLIYCKQTHLVIKYMICYKDNMYWLAVQLSVST